MEPEKLTRIMVKGDPEPWDRAVIGALGLNWHLSRKVDGRIEYALARKDDVTFETAPMASSGLPTAPAGDIGTLPGGVRPDVRGPRRPRRR